MSVRPASHAGTWYDNDEGKLNRQLTSWLDAVDASRIPRPPMSVIDEVTGGGLRSAGTSSSFPTFPAQNLRAIIAPHAGYSYSGPAAAYAYKAVDRSAFDRVFILGPSHHVYLDGCALSACTHYETPIGNLPLDLDTIRELRATGKFEKDMDLNTDADEHSIEMHLPYIRKAFDHRTTVKIVPILIGSISAAKEAAFGELLAPYLQDPQTLFVISSDFCHWGSRFRYTHYRGTQAEKARSLSNRDTIGPSDPPIHASIRALDGTAIAKLTYPDTLPVPDASELAKTGRASPADATSFMSATPRTAKDAQEAFREYLKDTGNTICGRHPIGVLLGALAALERRQQIQSQLTFTRYEQSSQCQSPRDSSVSYASAWVQFT